MTREELLYKIYPTDTTYDCRTGNKYCNCDDCVNEMNVWLEEYDKQIRADAIDDCLNILKIHKNNWGVIEWAIRDIEKLKENKK